MILTRQRPATRSQRERNKNVFKYELGNRSEGVVLSAYLCAGFAVSIPFGTGASYDLVVDAGARLLKVQVKTAWVSDGCVRYKSQRRQPGRGLTRRPYRSGEADYFAAYCPQTSTIYVVPAENHGNEGRLRLDPTRNGQSKMVKRAADYLWERHVEELKKYIRLARIELATSCSGDRRSIH